MARPRSFDESAALDAATALFWAKGYDVAGMSDLVQATGVLRGSLYKAWGSKKGLFLACLNRYDTTHIAPGIAFLEGVGTDLSGAQRIAAVFTAHDPRGCLMCNAAAGPAGTDNDVAEWVRGRYDALRSAFATALRDSDTDLDCIPAEAERLTQRYVGMRVRQRAGGDIAAGSDAVKA